MSQLKRTKPNSLDTSQRIYHVFGCAGPIMHVWSGQAILTSGNGLHCPTCGYSVKDVTNTRLGKEYFAFGRPDLSEKS